jgi:hypothetical protein
VVLRVPALAFLLLGDAGAGKILGGATTDVFAWPYVTVIVATLICRRLEEIGAAAEVDPPLSCGGHGCVHLCVPVVRSPSATCCLPSHSSAVKSLST